ncbi:acyltransferase [Nonomuraea sp. NPDC050556]|uniref:acyltransferase n=1 Tax=Nonomuraea sp. NPDC050556 TaxID=3364369 RepID=UPI0037B0F86E
MSHTVDILRATAKATAARALHRGWNWVQDSAAITPGTPLSRRFARFGEGARIAFPQGAIYGEPWICIGPHTLIGAHVTVSAGLVPGLDLGPELVIAIGSGCTIGRGSHLVGHECIIVGADVVISPNVYITDQNHSYADPYTPIGRQWAENQPVSIGDGCWIGTGAIILPGTHLGRNVAVAAGSVVRGEFPSHCVIAGAPARIIRRYLPGTGWHPPRRTIRAVPD